MQMEKKHKKRSDFEENIHFPNLNFCKETLKKRSLVIDDAPSLCILFPG